MMSPLGRFVPLCFFTVLCVGQSTKNLNANKDIPKTASVANEEMGRFIKVDYMFETESVLYDVVENKDKAPSTTVAGNFTFESLHHDLESGMLGRYRLTICKTGNCGNVPDIYVSFIQGGNNIQEVFYDATQFPNEEPRWNFLFAIINTIYTPAENAKGDDQVVDTVYGRCLVQFSRPEDKRFRRRISNCELRGDTNFTRIGGIQPVLYEQDVSYRQNTKIDPDIVIIDAVEQLSFRTPLHKKWGFTVESRTHVEITNRTMQYTARHCNFETHTAAKCASEEFGAAPVGKKLYERVLLGQKNKKYKFAQLVSEFRKHFTKMSDSHRYVKDSAMFAEIVQEGRLASEQDWKTVLMRAENKPILHVLGNALGALGHTQSLKIAQEVLLVQEPLLLDDYLLGAAHTTSNDHKWHKQLMYWLNDVKNDSVTYWKLANTIATVLRRRCDRTPSSRNQCHFGKEKIVTKFIDDISACKSEECHLKFLDVLRNIPISASLEVARGFLCTSVHTPAVQIAALQVIKASSSSLYDIKLANVLVKLFRNVCPQPTSTGESQLAIDILVRCLPEHQHVATMLLRTETLNPDNHEKWQYFYKALQSRGQQDQSMEEFWHQMRKFKVFRPNYAHRALIANSHSHWSEIADLNGYKIHTTSSAEFEGGMFKRSEFDIRMKHGKLDESLFGLTTLASGLDSFVGEQTTLADPEAKVWMSFLGHTLPPVTLFKGASELMAAVWNADGESVKVFEGYVMLRETDTALPLLSGLTVKVASSGALAFKVLTSATVSLWNQQSFVDVNTNLSMSLNSHIFLLHHGETVNTLYSNLALVAGVGAESEALFSQIPFEFCVRMQHNDAQISFESVYETTKKPRKKTTVTASKTYPGVTFRLDDSITNQCNQLRRSAVE